MIDSNSFRSDNLNVGPLIDASGDDRLWFREHPDARMRCRPISPPEAAESGLPADTMLVIARFPDGLQVQTIVPPAEPPCPPHQTADQPEQAQRLKQSLTGRRREAELFREPSWIPVLKVPLQQINSRPQRDFKFDPRGMSDYDLGELIDDIRRRGLQHPVELTPDFELITGRRRVAAVEWLGWVEIPAIIRYDLAEQGKAAIQQHMIADNLYCRHLTSYERVSYAFRLAEVECGGRYDETEFDCVRTDIEFNLRDRIGRMRNVPKQEVADLFYIVLASRDVQLTYLEGLLSRSQAVKFARRPKGEQDRMLYDFFSDASHQAAKPKCDNQTQPPQAMA